MALVALYARALDAPWVWTDETSIGQRTMLRPPGQWLEAFREPLHRMPGGGEAARQSYYRPLPVIWLSALDAAFDSSPRAFRLGALAVTGLALAAFAALAWTLVRSAGPVLLAVGWVALHPVHIESTVWISGVSGIGCALFSLLALGLALAAWRAAPRRAVAWGALAALALLAALLSKERALVVPALLLALLISASRLPHLRPPGGAAARAGLLCGAALVVAAGFWALLRPAVLGEALTPLPPIDGRASTQLLSAVASWPASLGWLFWPWRSTTNDAVRIVVSAADAGFLLGAALALGSVVAWGLLLRAGRPVAALGLAWVWIAFLPTSGLVPLLHPRGERYLLLSSFGAALLWADLGAWALARLGARRAAPLAACALVLLLGWRTWVRLGDWQSTETLFRVELRRDPEYREARFLLAAAATERGLHAEADALLRPLLFPSGARQRAGYVNLTSSYALGCAIQVHRGRPRGALELEARAGPSIAATPMFQVCLGQARETLGEVDAALENYRAALRSLGAEAPEPLRGRIRQLEQRR